MELIEASMKGDIKEALAQLEKGTPVDFEDPAGQTSLFWAVMNNDKALVEELLKRGADVLKQNQTGQTPLMGGALRGHVDMIDILLQRGSKIDSTDSTGLTAFAWAALRNHEPACMRLLDRGADPMQHHRFNSEQLPLIGLDQLAQWNGEGQDRKLCMGVLGLVYDVSAGWEFYGPGGSYSSFSGKDATIALGKHVVETEASAETDYNSLTMKQRMEAEGWAAKFKQKYRVVGRLESLNLGYVGSQSSL